MVRGYAKCYTTCYDSAYRAAWSISGRRGNIWPITLPVKGFRWQSDKNNVEDWLRRISLAATFYAKFSIATKLRPAQHDSSGSALILLFSLYSEPAFYSGYIVDASSLLVPACKGVLGQQHGRIQVNEAEPAQPGHKMRGRARGQARLHHRADHQLSMCRPANGGDIQRLHEAALHQLDVYHVDRAQCNQMCNVGRAVGAFIRGDGHGCMLCYVTQPLVIVLVHRLLHQQRANIAIIQRLQAEQRFIRRVTLIGIKRQAKSRRALADGLDASDVIANIASDLDLDAGNTARHDVLCQFIAVFRRDHGDAHIGLDHGAGTAEKDVKRYAVGTGESIQQRHLHPRASGGLGEVDAVHQLRKPTQVCRVLALDQFRAAASGGDGRFLRFAGTWSKWRAFTIAYAAVVERDGDKHVLRLRDAPGGNGERLQQGDIERFGGDRANSGTRHKILFLQPTAIN